MIDTSFTNKDALQVIDNLKRDVLEFDRLLIITSS